MSLSICAGEGHNFIWLNFNYLVVHVCVCVLGGSKQFMRRQIEDNIDYTII